MGDMSDFYSAYGVPSQSVPPPVAPTAPTAAPNGQPQMGTLTITPDGPGPQASAPAPPHNDLADFQAAFAAPPKPKPTATDIATDMAQSAGSGVVKGVIGAPVAGASLAKMGADAIVGGGDWLVRKALGLGPASPEWKAKQAQAAAAADADSPIPSAIQLDDMAQKAVAPALHTATTTEGKYADTAGQFLPFLGINPASVAKVGVDAPALISKITGAANTAAAAPAAATLGGAASHVAGSVLAPAVVSEAAGQATQGMPLEPYARLAGGFAGGIGAAGAGKAAEAVGNSPTVAALVARTPILGNALKQDVGNGVAATPQQLRIAGQNLVGKAEDPNAFVQALNPDQPATPAGAAGPDSAIPGFQPTTGELTGDSGVLQAQRADARGNPEATGQSGPAPYLDQKTAQDKAQSDFLAAGRTPADHTAVTAHLNDQLDQINQDATQQISDASTVARGKADDAITSPGAEATNANVRDTLTAANDAAKAEERSLHQAIDPDGTLSAATDPINESVQKAYGKLSPTAQAFISPEERQFLDIIKRYNPTEPYRDVADLSSELAGAMRAAKMDPKAAKAYGRMTVVMGGIKNALSKTVQDRSAVETQAVADGQLAPQNTMASRLQERINAFSAERQQTAARSNAGQDVGAGDSGAQGVLPGMVGAGEQTGSGSGNVAGTQSVSSDAGAAGRISAANAATKNRHDTFSRGTVGQVIAPGPGGAGSFRIPDSAIPAKVFPKGARGYEAVNAYHKAAGTGADAVSALQDIAMEQLRPKLSDGMIAPKDLAKFKADYEPALRAMDEVSPGFSSKFDDATKASQAVLDATNAKKDILKNYQSGVIGKLIGARGSDEVQAHIKTLLSAKDRIPQIDRLVASVSDNPDAVAGLRSAVQDVVAKKFTKTLESGDQLKPGALAKVLSDDEPALARVLPKSDIDNLRLVARTMDQQALTINSRLQGGSDTSPNHNASGGGLKGHAANGTFLLAAMEGLQYGHEIGGVKGAAIAVATPAAYMLKALRTAGIKDINGLMGEALRNPDVARQLVKRVSPDRYREQRIAGIVKQAIATGPRDDGSGSSPPPSSGPFSPNGRPPPPTAELKDWLARGPQKEPFADRTKVDAPDPVSSTSAKSPSEIEAPKGGLTLDLNTERPSGTMPQQGQGYGDRTVSASMTLPEPHPEADATHQAILAHESRIATQAQKGQAARERAPQSLVSFLQANGGMKDIGGDLKASGATRYPGLVTKNGLSPDRAREMAAEAGYLGADTEHAVANTSVNDLLDAIGSHPTYSVHDQDRVSARTAKQDERAYQTKFASARQDLVETLKQDHGFQDGDFDHSLIGPATHHVMEGKDPLDAYEKAIRDKLDTDHEASAAARAAWKAEAADIPFFGENDGRSSSRDAATQSGASGTETSARDAGRGQESVPNGSRQEPRRTRQDRSAQSVPASARSVGEEVRNYTTGETIKAGETSTMADMLRRFDVSDDKGVDDLQRASHMVLGHILKGRIGEMPVHVVDSAAMKVLAKDRINLPEGYTAGGFYDPITHQIVVLDQALKDPAEASRLVIHEGLHGAFFRTMERNDDAKALVDTLREAALDHHNANGGAPNAHYGLTNAHEFVSEAFSNPNFQRFLNSIPASDHITKALSLGGRSGSMWDAFTGAVRRILGMKPDQHSMLDAAMRAGEMLDHVRSQPIQRVASPVAASPRPPTPSPQPGILPPPSFQSRLSSLLGGSP